MYSGKVSDRDGRSGSEMSKPERKHQASQQRDARKKKKKNEKGGKAKDDTE